jgi:hypothetical protein
MAAPRQIINSLKSGMNIEKALLTATELTVDQFERDFKVWAAELASN